MANNKTQSTGKKHLSKMTRSEALVAMGSMAATLPFMKPADYSKAGQTASLSSAQQKTLKDPVLSSALSELEYLTPADKFRVQRRGNPVLTEIPEEKLPSIGLARETWKLEIIPDPESNPEIENPLTRESGNALDWPSLMKLAETKAVRFLHVLTCTNVPKPYGMGLWEGVPLRDIFWMTKPKQNIRRIFFYGYHNDDPKQIFQASLPINRVLEEVPGELPVVLCYKLNGKYISQANGGPVRLIVPGLYGNRWIKWLQKIVITNSFKANDTYAESNNDVEVPIKTCARFIKAPEIVKAGQKFAVTGFAQVGLRGLAKVQYCLLPADSPLPADDPYLNNAEWKDAIILPAPEKWGSDLPEGKLPDVLQFDSKSGQPSVWPVPNTIVHWATLARVDSPGKYSLRCRSIDKNGTAQPMPYPFGRSGNNRIEIAAITCESA
jgi:DMSO/TMAO reductase YedYZ molybdopterin-dependent catalytic subunit